MNKLIGKKILLVGNAGFVGSNFQLYLSEYKAGWQYIINGIDKSLTSIYNINNDLSKKTTFDDIFNVDIIINFAAHTSVDDSFNDINGYMNNNYNLTNNIFEHLIKINYKGKYIHISTDEVYGESVDENDIKYETSPFNPSNPYSISKCACEYLCEYYKKITDINIIIVRPNNIYGSTASLRVINNFISRARYNEPLIIHGDGTQTRNFLHIKDFCNALCKIMEKCDTNEIFNIGSNNNYSIKELAELIINKRNSNSTIEYIENRKVQDKNYYINSDKLKSYGWHEIEDIDYFLSKLI